MKLIVTVTLAQMISWAVFILDDYMTEILSISTFSGLSILAMPLLMSVLYLFYRKRIDEPDIPGWFNILGVLVIWIIEDIFLFEWIARQIDRGTWFIPQSVDRWEDMLNGLEYWVFATVNIAGPALIIPLGSAVIWLWRKKR